MYQKEIIYLGLYKDGDRLGSAGFLKVEKRDKEGNLSLVVKNVPHSINGKYPVRYYSGSDWKEADGITVREGGGQWETQEPDFLEQVRLQIMLPGGYLVEGASKAAAGQAATVKEEKKQDVQQPLASPRDDSTAEGTVPAQEETAAVYAKPVPEQSAAAKPVLPEPEQDLRELTESLEEEAAAAAKPPVPEPQKIERIVVQKRGGRVSGAAAEQAQKPLMADALVIEGLKEDKWEQILDTYDNIHPYDDGRVYVKLEPKDFIIMSGKYQHLVNNSFLLHGFYNYRHVILGKEGEAYYLGVPGVFYEREKMVALMFGFEAFECGSGESKPGEFGYYLRKVEL